jgi:hypothetical protein
MAVTKHDLDAFHDFAEAKLESRHVDSLHELVDIWESEHTSPQLHAQNVAAVQAAIRDMEAGDKGRPAKNIVEEMRSELARRSTQ